MAKVILPSLFGDTTGGVRHVVAPGGTVGEVIDALDRTHPGLGERIRREGRLVSYLAVTVDGKIATAGLATPVGSESEVAVLFNMGGG
jgi:molybdopterin converting factor small subunit